MRRRRRRAPRSPRSGPAIDELNSSLDELSDAVA